MKPIRRLGLPAFLSFALVGAACSPAFAWDYFKKHGHCDHDHCDAGATREVASRAVIQENVRVSRGIAPIGTVFMPLMLPVAGGTLTRDFDTRDLDTREVDPLRDEGDGMRSAYRAVRANLRQEQARLALKAEIETKQRLLDMIASSKPTSAAASGTLESQLEKINENIAKLTERIAAVERLTLIHDNYLQDKIKKDAGKE